MKAKLIVGIILGFTLAQTAHALPNSWAAGSGKWETVGNWSLGIPPASTQGILITNTGHSTVTIDATTTNSPATMSISNLTVSGNNLSITSTGTNLPLIVGGALSISTNSSLAVSNGALLGMATVSINGSMSCNSSSVVATNGGITLGSLGGANVTLSINGGLALFNAGTLTTVSGAKSTWLIQGGTTMFSGALNVGQSGAGTLTLSAGTLSAFGNLVAGVNFAANGFIFINGGTMIVTNSMHNATIDVRHGSFILSNGTVLTDIFMATNTVGTFINNGATLIVTSQARMDQGTQTVAGGMAQINSSMVVASTATSTGTVNLTGGSLAVTNGVLGVGNNGNVVGDGGFGSLAVSNATVLAKSVVLGSTLGGHGVMTLKSGGVLRFPDVPDSGCADCGLSLNEAILDGGEIDAASSPFFAGRSRPGEMIVSNGVATFQSGYIGIDNPGTFEMDGGVVTLLSNMVVGDCGAAVTGNVRIAGGNLYVTNATHDAVLDVRDGVFTLSGGLVQVDVLVMTNSCGLFVHNGGTLVYSTAVLDPNGDSDGDGIPNGYEQNHGLNPFNAADAGADNDGDGFTNFQEFQAGTDPNDAGSSPLRITSILQQHNDILITWSTFAGTTNALQATVGAVAFGYATTDYYDVFVVTNAVGNVTNYLDSAVLTNTPARYYRVRLVP